MRLVTRGDLDGLTSAVILTSVETIDDVLLVHPQDITDRRVRITSDDVLANLPYEPNCGMWFDHHLQTDSNEQPPAQFKGNYGLAPSAARLVFDYYRESHPAISEFERLVDETDRLDSAKLEPVDVTHPTDYILLGYTIDNRSGLGADFRNYFMTVMEALKEMTIKDVLKHPIVRERVDRLHKETEEFREVLNAHTRLEGNVIITDLRDLDSLPAGNRFLVYTLFPRGNVSVRIHWGPRKQTVIAAVGHNIFNRTCKTSIGDLMSHYGGGGHRGAGTCMIPIEDAEEALDEIVATLKRNG